MPFDLNEVRRRRLIGPKTQFLGGEPEGGAPGQIPKNAPSSMIPAPPEAPSAASRYEQFLSTEPKSGDYPPGVLRRILAAAAGFGTGYNQGGAAGAETTGSILHAPYERAYQDWANKGVGLDRLAELEGDEAMQSYRDTMAEASGRRAGAFETSAGANVLRAEKAPTHEQRVIEREAGRAIPPDREPILTPEEKYQASEGLS